MSNIRRTVAALLLTVSAVAFTGVAAQADAGTQDATTTPRAATAMHWEW